MIRFTQTEKWEDKWFRKLTVGQKLIFLYLCDKCNLGGFLEWDGEMVSFQIGVEADKIEGALEALARGIIVKGEYIWIKNFLKHQKNSPINPNNPAHKNIIRCIDERKEFHKEIEEIYGPLKPLFRGIGIGKGISKGKGNTKRSSKYKDSEELSGQAETIYQIYPYHESKPSGIEAIKVALFNHISFEELAQKVRDYAGAVKGADLPKYIPKARTWFEGERWTESIESWTRHCFSSNQQPPEESTEDLDSTLDKFRGVKS